MAPGDVEKGAARKDEQPFVGRENHKIRVKPPMSMVRTPALCVASITKLAPRAERCATFRHRSAAVDQCTDEIEQG